MVIAGGSADAGALVDSGIFAETEGLADLGIASAEGLASAAVGGLDDADRLAGVSSSMSAGLADAKWSVE